MVWEYEYPSKQKGVSKWIPFTKSVSEELTKGCRDFLSQGSHSESFRVNSADEVYTIDYTSFTRTNVSTKVVENIRNYDSSSSLTCMFGGGYGFKWERVLTTLINCLKDAPKFVGEKRDDGIVPMRELTFQSIKPLSPENWNIIFIAQQPSASLQSATGVPILDPALEHWNDKGLGLMSSMRSILKAAAMANYDLRALISDKRVISPPQWFQSMISQGILFLNASFTTGGAISNSGHSAFWLPVLRCIIEQIMLAKSRLPASDKRRALVVTWWSSSMKSAKHLVETVVRNFSDVPVRIINWYSPAARGGQFCQGTPHFTIVNQKVNELGMSAINWLPTERKLVGKGLEPAALRDFIQVTKEWHSIYLRRLKGELKFEEDIEPITGVRDTPLLPLEQVYSPLRPVMRIVLNSVSGVCNEVPLNQEEKAIVYLYTTGFIYRALNNAMRLKQCQSFFPYLAWFLQAHDKLPPAPENTELYRGITTNVADEYSENQVVTWWSFTSCSGKKQISEKFTGGCGSLFFVSAKTAVAIMDLAADKSQDEYLLAPGTRLLVLQVDRQQPCAHIYVKEIRGDRLVR